VLSHLFANCTGVAAVIMSAQHEYTYKPPEPSFLFKHVLAPTYDRVVLWYPRWWTPNGITVFGILCTLAASCAFLATGQPAAKAPTPLFGDWLNMASFLPGAHQWNAAAAAASSDTSKGGTAAAGLFFPVDQDACMLIAVGVLNLVYCLADNTDGRQARRLRLSSPVGEYLDHGLDCVTSLLSVAVTVGCGGLSYGAGAVALMVIAYITNLSHVLNLRRNIFIWGTEWVSVDEAMIGFGVVPIAMGLWPGFRASTIADVGVAAVGVPAGIAASVRIVDCLFVGFLLSQPGMVLKLTAQMPALPFQPLAVIQAAVLAVLAAAASAHKGGTAPAIAKQLISGSALGVPGLGSYPVIWFATAAFAASAVVHCSIIAKCVAKTAGTDAANAGTDKLPLIAIAGALYVFWQCPHGGLFLAVAAHTCQALLNVCRLYWTQAERRRREGVVKSD
jgi:phosphatidylglycerophosphate synthase